MREREREINAEYFGQPRQLADFRWCVSSWPERVAMEETSRANGQSPKDNKCYISEGPVPLLAKECLSVDEKRQTGTSVGWPVERQGNGRAGGWSDPHGGMTIIKAHVRAQRWDRRMIICHTVQQTTAGSRLADRGPRYRADTWTD